jgi:hypothetical protein
MLLIGLVFLGVTGFKIYDERRFDREAVGAEGTILTKVIRTSIDRGGATSTGTRRQHHEATYRFTVDGVTVEGREELARGTWEGLTEGARVGVLYLPADPGSNRLAGSRPWLWTTIFGLVGLVLTPIGGVLAIREFRRAALEARLRARGTSTQGVVTQLSEESFQEDDEYMWRLTFEYADARGQRHVSALTVSRDEAQHWKVGDVGLVRYDAANPTQAVWLGRESSGRSV